LTTKEVFSFNDAIANFRHQIEATATLNLGSFSTFIRDVWSKGYDNPHLFTAWHVGQICEDIEYCLEKGLFYCGVMPRIHFKSTILGHGFAVWNLLRAPGMDADMLYLSYSDGMAQRHIAEIKKAVRRNPIIMEHLKDKTPQADFSFRYKVDGKKSIEILHGGVFSFKRGLHVKGMIADDILRDPDNPLNPTQLYKVEDHFMTESMFIPVRGTPVIVLGTPMLPGDIFTKLQEDDRFFVRVLPALDPAPGRRVLFPEMYDEAWLLQQQKANPRSFASEFMLAPYLLTNSFLDEKDLSACENPKLKSLNPNKHHDLDSDYTVAGFDVGKKVHPSHLTVYTMASGGKPKQVLNYFMKGWSYTKQVQFLNKVAINFDIDKGYFDNTRGELEDRDLVADWHPLTFTSRTKNQMAAKFEEYVVNNKIEMIDDKVQHSQIISVDGELRAPETPLGHGDAFWSNALAVLAHSEHVETNTQIIGNMQDFWEGPVPEEDGYARRMKAINDFGGPGEVTTETCPRCDAGHPAWVPENDLCLICDTESLE
jgi:hypothetical protein